MNEDLSIETERLRLVAANAEMARLELHDRARLFARLGVTPPAVWPPPLNDENSFAYFLLMVESDPASSGWGYWYVIERKPGGEPVGIVGFKGKSDSTGMVEVGYSIVESRHGQGYCSEAISALLDWAKARGATAAIAETYPELAASIRIMEKLGMQFEGPGSEENVIRYRCSL